MGTYIVRRILLLIPLLLGITLLVFLIMYALPMDPVEQMMAEWGATGEQLEELRHQLGLDDPFHVQYFRFLSGAVQGDFGTAIHANRPVTQEMLRQLPATIRLTLAAIIVSVVIGIPLGTLAAIRRNSWIDTGTMMFALVGVSMPNFWLGLVMLYAFSFKLGWFPFGGAGDGLTTLFLPAVVLGTSGAAIIARVSRSSLLEVLSQDYVRTARAKGLRERIVVLKHAMRNSMIPVITMIGLQLGFLISGSVVIEIVFSRPGLGQMLATALIQGDFPVVQGTVVLAAVGFVLANLLVDLSYVIFDPRIRYG